MSCACCTWVCGPGSDGKSASEWGESGGRGAGCGGWRACRRGRQESKPLEGLRVLACKVGKPSRLADHRMGEKRRDDAAPRRRPVDS